MRLEISEELQRRLAAVGALGGATVRIRIVLLVKPRGFRALASNLDLHACGDAIPFVAAELSVLEITHVLRDRCVVAADLDPMFKAIPEPLAVEGPLQKDVAARYKVGRLAELDGDGVRVVVADTGLADHPDLPRGVHRVDVTGDGNGGFDTYGHGTACGGQIVAGGPYPGLAPRAELHSVRIFNRNLWTSRSWILASADLAIRAQAHVYSGSFGGPIPDPVTALGFRKMVESGVTVIAAIGNNGPGEGTALFPGGYAHVVGVGAIDKEGGVASFSSRGWPGRRPVKPDCVAEGVNIVMLKAGRMGTPVGERHCAASGTSFACPIVAGLAALACESIGAARRDPAEVRRRLLSACESSW